MRLRSSSYTKTEVVETALEYAAAKNWGWAVLLLLRLRVQTNPKSTSWTLGINPNPRGVVSTRGEIGSFLAGRRPPHPILQHPWITPYTFARTA
jgi:hypothetical protein